MFRVFRCTLHRNCHRCHYLYQKCWRQIHLLSFIVCEAIIIRFYTSFQRVFPTSAENRCGYDAYGGGGEGGGGGWGGDGFSSLHTGFCVTGAFCFAGFISSSGNCCPLNHKGTNSPSLFLVHTEVQGSICISQRYVQCFYG